MDYERSPNKDVSAFSKNSLSFLCAQKEKLASERGITLLALILTVVIMIILAGVTINVTLGDGGLIDQAQHAAEVTINSTKAEQEQLDDLVSQLNEIIGGRGGVTNTTPGEDTNQIEATNTVDTNTIDPEPEPPDPLPDDTISIGEPQWQPDGTANVTVSTTEPDVTIEYQIGGTDEDSWIPVEGGIIEGIENGETVYVRITDGEQASNPQEITVKDEIDPTVTVTAQGSPTTNSITVTAVASDNESGMVESPTYTFQIKQSSQGSYTTPSGAENISSATYTFTGLTQGTTYDIQVIVNGDNAGNSGTGTTQATTNTVPGADAGLQTGSITASPVTWSGGKASTTLTTNELGFQIQYQVNEVVEGSWLSPANSPITVSNLDHGDTVYARLWDGNNGGDYAAINIIDGTDPTVSVTVGTITETSIEVSVSASDGQSGLATSGTYRYYLNNDLKQTTESAGYTFTGLTGGTQYTIRVEAMDKAGRTGSDTTQVTTQQASIPETETQVANYADVDGNGTVDGVIYADLAVGGRGTWNPSGNSSYDSNGTYTIPTSGNFKKYKVTQESYSGSFGTGKVVTPVDPNSSSGNERFYVMALSDVDSSSHYWYYSAFDYGMSDSASQTSTAFGRGEQNTINMISKWNSSGYGTQNAGADSSFNPDMWGVSAVNSRTWNDTSGWYVPSLNEWAAFAGELNITSNYSNYGLSNFYWSSSQYITDRAYVADFRNGYMHSYHVYYNYYVRLGTTF